MDVQPGPTILTSSREEQSFARLHGRWLLLARIGWAALVALTLSIFFASLPVYLAQMETPCAGAACQWQQLTHSQAEMLKGMGLSLADYAVFTLALALASVVMCLVVSTLIIWRRPDDRIAFIVALMLVTLGPIIVVADPPAASPWWVPNACLTFLTGFLLVLVFLLFPTGQFVPHWMRWTLVVFLVGDISSFFPDTPLLPNVSVSQPGWLVVVGELTTVAAAQLYRYRRVSSPRERQQTKWVVFGLAVPITVYMLLTVLGLFFPMLVERSPLLLLASNEAGFTLPLFLPLSFSFAILRYRLWDIDSIINRTLVYGTLTVTLTGVYVGLVIGLQALLRGLISQDNSVAIVLSTLAIAALFQPLRQGIQRSIDRRFYRRKYDAAKTLAAFSATLRNEVDLDQLREQFVAVVQETMQPTHVSLWLRPPAPARKQSAAWSSTPAARLHEEETSPWDAANEGGAA
jgi:hypothetical protein